MAVGGGGKVEAEEQGFIYFPYPDPGHTGESWNSLKVLKDWGPTGKVRLSLFRGSLVRAGEKQNWAGENLADWDPLGSLEKDWGSTGKEKVYISLQRIP
jgi:hypothetical protein